VIAGIDLGGTKIAACVANESGVVARARAPVPRSGDERTIARAMLALLDGCCREAGVSSEALQAVGVAACGPFEGLAGQLASAAPNLCGGLSPASDLPNRWMRVALEEPLLEAFGERTLAIANDAQAALCAEYRFGALRGVSHGAYLTWSTGIGVGLMLDGRLVRGKSGNAGHAGHSLVPSAQSLRPRCGCGNEGDVESLAGGAALARAWGGETLDLFNACRRGESAAVAIVDGALDAIADLVYNLFVTLDLERIAIGGGLFCSQSDVLLPALRARLFESGRYPGMRGMLAGASVVAVSDPARTAELGALCLVLPQSWQLRWSAEFPAEAVAAIAA
jgi:glucokinase